MPFTLAHPAAVLPFSRKWRLPFAALAAGSVAPDTGYFLTLNEYFRENAHTLVRSFTFCLPAGLALLLVFTAARPGFLSLLPRALRDILDEMCEPNPWLPARFPFTVAAVLLGAWTHLFWDSWTHSTGWFVVRLPALSKPWLLGISAHRLLQHFSTAAGLLALYLFFAHEARLRGAPLRFRFSHLAAWWCFAILAAALFTAATLESPWNYWISGNEHRTLFLAIVTFLRNLGLLTLIAAAALTARRKNI